MIIRDSQPFAVGDLVHLRAAAFGMPGRVERLGKRVTVHWPDLNFTGKHSREALILARQLSIANPTCPAKPAPCLGFESTVRELSVFCPCPKSK
jgi:hypothetical protein